MGNLGRVASGAVDTTTPGAARVAWRTARPASNPPCAQGVNAPPAQFRGSTEGADLCASRAAPSVAGSRAPQASGLRQPADPAQRRRDPTLKTPAPCSQCTASLR
jgi:hypothetical protein